MHAGLVKVTVIFVPLLLMDRIGRRPLLIASNVGICLAQLLISMSFLFGPNNSSGGDTPEPEPEPESEPDIPPLSKWLAVGGQCAFVASFSLGVGPLAHVLSSELYPLRLRGARPFFYFRSFSLCILFLDHFALQVWRLGLLHSSIG